MHSATVGAMGFSLRVLSLVCALMPFVNARGREYDGLDLQCLDATLVQTCDDILIGMQLGLLATVNKLPL